MDCLKYRCRIGVLSIYPLYERYHRRLFEAGFGGSPPTESGTLAVPARSAGYTLLLYPPEDHGLIHWLQNHNEAIGNLAAVLTTSAFFPQVLRTWRLRSEKQRQELSWTMLILFGTGVGLWFVYGYFRASGPIMLANGATGILILAIVVIKAWRH